MFTVSVRNKATGIENLFGDVRAVECKDGDRLIMTYPDDSQTVLNTSLASDDFRDIFVMNSAGKTVARYWI